MPNEEENKKKRVKLKRAKINKTKPVDNVDKKVRALDGLFSIVEVTIDKITAATETIIGGFVGFFESLFKKKKIKKEEDE